jgi:acetyl-CoA acyltransferase
MRQVVIANYGRTPFSRARPKDPQQDPLSALTGEDLLAGIVPQVLSEAQVSGAEVDDFIVGCALGVGEQWTFGGRTSSLRCGLPPSVPARSVDMQCGSGMAAIQIACGEIATGQADIVVVGGMEQMTRVPVGPTLFEKGYLAVNPKLLRRTADWDMLTGLNMGLTAELLAERQGYSRAQLDDLAVRSHRRAALALDQGYFQGEIIPVTDEADGNSLLLAVDQSLRRETCRADLDQLKPVFKADGVITAGNSSPLNAGAAAMVLMAEEIAETRGIRPIARILVTTTAGVRPELMATGPVPATQKALRLAKLATRDIDLWEINEAFSVVVLYAAEQLDLKLSQINMNGGALALGHPLGATGIRLVGTLARTLNQTGQKRGCATACVGGGQGIATLIEAC